MKHRKNIVVAFLVVAAMMLSVGYAALEDTLTITGSLGANTSVALPEFDADVYFSATNIVADDTGNQAASQILEGRDDAKITANHFTTQGQRVKVKYTITNESTTFAAELTPTVLSLEQTGQGAVSNPHEYVFSADWSWNEITEDISTVTIQPEDSKDLWVTITLLETPTENHEIAFTVSYTALAVDPENP